MKGACHRDVSVLAKGLDKTLPTDSDGPPKKVGLASYEL